MTATDLTTSLAPRLADWVRDARRQTIALVADLPDSQLLGARLLIVNPLLWEIGHVAWFQEKWVLRHVHGQPPLRPDGDALYDSAAVPHNVRWDLPLPARNETLAYLYQVRDQVLQRLEHREAGQEEVYFILLSIFHEDMHTEAFTYTRQTLGYPPPRLPVTTSPAPDVGPLPGDVHVPGGTYLLGATHGEPFVFDNDKWPHPLQVQPFH